MSIQIRHRCRDSLQQSVVRLLSEAGWHVDAAISDSSVIVATPGSALLQEELEHNPHYKSSNVRSAGSRPDTPTLNSGRGSRYDGYACSADRARACCELADRLPVDEQFLALLKQQHSSFSSSPCGVPQEARLLDCLRSHGLLVSVSPLHEPQEVHKLLQRAWRTLLLPETTFRNYFGEEVGYYVAFLNALLMWLLPPALVSTWLAYALRNQRAPGGTAAGPVPAALHSGWVPLLSLLLVVWGGIGLKLWARRSARLAWRWDVHVAALRQETWEGFRGRPSRSPITGETILVYPAAWRAARVAVTSAVTLVTLGLAAGVLLLVLNLQGDVPVEHSWLYLAWLSSWTLPGAALDKSHAVLGLVPTGVRVVVTQLITETLSPVFKGLTDFENHATVNAYAASLQAKRFTLQALLVFGPVAYVALAGAGAAAAAADIASYYLLECARRLAMEVVLPALQLHRSLRQHTQQLAALKQQTREKPPGALLAAADAWRPPYESFDDYLSVVKDLGYILLFAGVYPFTPAIALVYTWVKMKADAFKLARVYQRPRPRRVASIAPWGALVAAQVYLAVITNVYLSGISTQQLCDLFPPSWAAHLPCAAPPDPALVPVPASTDANKMHLQHPAVHPVVSSTPWVQAVSPSQLLFLVGLEHLLYLLLVVIHVAIPAEPAAVRTAQQKAAFLLRQLDEVQRRRSITQELSLGRSHSAGLTQPLAGVGAGAAVPVAAPAGFVM